MPAVWDRARLEALTLVPLTPSRFRAVLLRLSLRVVGRLIVVQLAAAELFSLAVQPAAASLPATAVGFLAVQFGGKSGRKRQ